MLSEEAGKKLKEALEKMVTPGHGGPMQPPYPEAISTEKIIDLWEDWDDLLVSADIYLGKNPENDPYLKGISQCMKDLEELLKDNEEDFEDERS
jgi:hypothetical protein